MEPLKINVSDEVKVTDVVVMEICTVAPVRVYMGCPFVPSEPHFTPEMTWVSTLARAPSFIESEFVYVMAAM